MHTHQTEHDRQVGIPQMYCSETLSPDVELPADCGHRHSFAGLQQNHPLNWTQNDHTVGALLYGDKLEGSQDVNVRVSAALNVDYTSIGRSGSFTDGLVARMEEDQPMIPGGKEITNAVQLV